MLRPTFPEEDVAWKVEVERMLGDLHRQSESISIRTQQLTQGAFLGGIPTTGTTSTTTGTSTTSATSGTTGTSTSTTTGGTSTTTLTSTSTTTPTSTSTTTLPPLGRCCSGIEAPFDCAVTIEADCDGVGQTWFEGEDCAGDPCNGGSTTTQP